MDLDTFEDAPLARFHIERLTPAPEGQRQESNPIIPEGAFVSWPYLIGADDQSREEYRNDRLFTLRHIDDQNAVEIDIAGAVRVLASGEPVVIQHDEQVRVTLSGLTSRAGLRKEATG